MVKMKVLEQGICKTLKCLDIPYEIKDRIKIVNNICKWRMIFLSKLFPNVGSNKWLNNI
jgi:hypothetical protein